MVGFPQDVIFQILLSDSAFRFRLFPTLTNTYRSTFSDFCGPQAILKSVEVTFGTDLRKERGSERSKKMLKMRLCNLEGSRIHSTITVLESY